MHTNTLAGLYWGIVFNSDCVSSQGKGFTLIELLVVISIIALLASIILPALNSARGAARDAKRKSDMANIRTALLSYHALYGALPITGRYGETDAGGWDTSYEDGDGDGNYYLDFLVEAGLLAEGPVDPLNTIDGNHYYRYYCYPSGTNATRLRVYAVNLENEGPFTAIDEYGFNCSIDTTLPHNQ